MIDSLCLFREMVKSQKGKEEEGEHGQKFETYVTKMAKTGGVR